jgi:putative transposase
MTDYESLKHTRWECKYHLIFIPKWRKKRIYGQLRKDLGPVFRELARHKESEVEEGHLMGDHVHMLVSIPPKYSVAQVVGYMKGKSAIHIARTYMGKRQNFIGQNFWCRSPKVRPCQRIWRVPGSRGFWRHGGAPRSTSS